MDRRTKRQKLEAMANQSASPEEAEIAKNKLAELPPEKPQRFSNNVIYVNGIRVDGVTFNGLNYAEYPMSSGNLHFEYPFFYMTFSRKI